MNRSGHTQDATRIAILGGLGYLGRNLARHFLDSGFKVRLIDRATDAEGLESGLEYRCSDEGLACCLENSAVVIHLASVTTPALGEKNPELDLQNIRLTLDLIDAARKTGTGHIVFASSGGTVYGDIGHRPAKESDIPQPSCSYAVSKIASEYYLRLASERGGPAATVLRISNLYGNDQRVKGEQGVMGYILGRLRENRPVEIMGDTVRDYIHVDDACRAFLAAVRTAVGSGFRLYNISTGTGTSLSNLVRLMASRCSCHPHLEIGQRRYFDLEYNVLDNGRAERELGWKPLIGLEEGLEGFWE